MELQIARSVKKKKKCANVLIEFLLVERERERSCDKYVKGYNEITRRFFTHSLALNRSDNFQKNFQLR